MTKGKPNNLTIHRFFYLYILVSLGIILTMPISLSDHYIDLLTYVPWKQTLSFHSNQAIQSRFLSDKGDR